MLILKDQLLDAPVMSLQTGIELARTESLIIDPRQLKILGFYCKGPRLDHNPAVLHTADIREISELGVIVDSADNLMDPEDLVRLKDILQFNFSLEQKIVIQQNGKKLGRVSDYSVDVDSFFIVKLNVQPGVFTAWKTTQLVVGRDQISEITDTHIIVKDPTIKDSPPVKASSEALPRAVNNPFRQPQPEAMDGPKPE